MIKFIIHKWLRWRLKDLRNQRKWIVRAYFVSYANGHMDAHRNFEQALYDVDRTITRLEKTLL